MTILRVLFVKLQIQIIKLKLSVGSANTGPIIQTIFFIIVKIQKKHGVPNINNIHGREKNKNVKINIVKDNVSVDENQVSQHFTAFFSEIGNNLAKKIPTCGQDDIKKFNTLKSNPLSIFFDPIIDSDTCNIIFSMYVDKAPGVDDISVISRKCCVHNIAPILSDIFNLCIFYGVYPDDENC